MHQEQPYSECLGSFQKKLLLSSCCTAFLHLTANFCGCSQNASAYRIEDIAIGGLDEVTDFHVEHLDFILVGVDLDEQLCSQLQGVGIIFTRVPCAIGLAIVEHRHPLVGWAIPLEANPGSLRRQLQRFTIIHFHHHQKKTPLNTPESAEYQAGWAFRLWCLCV